MKLDDARAKCATEITKTKTKFATKIKKVNGGVPWTRSIEKNSSMKQSPA